MHILQILVSTLLLVVSAVLLITDRYVPGIVAMLLGGVLAFMNFRPR